MFIDRNPNKKKFYLKPVSDDFVFKELASFNASKSTCLDKIPPKFIRDGAHIIKKTHYCNYKPVYKFRCCTKKHEIYTSKTPK